MSLALAEAARNISIAAESKIDVMKIKLQVVMGNAGHCTCCCGYLHGLRRADLQGNEEET